MSPERRCRQPFTRRDQAFSVRELSNIVALPVPVSSSRGAVSPRSEHPFFGCVPVIVRRPCVVSVPKNGGHDRGETIYRVGFRESVCSTPLSLSLESVQKRVCDTILGSIFSPLS